MSDRSLLRVGVIRILVLSLLMTLGARAWYMQVMTGEQYSAAAVSNQTRQILTLPARGVILDAMGRPLVQNSTALVISVDRAALPKTKKGERNPVLDRLSSMLKMPYETIMAKIALCDYSKKLPPGKRGPKGNPDCWNGSPFQPIPIASVASGTAQATQLALRILEQHEEFPGITAQVQAVREYPAPEGVNLAQTLGHVQPISGEVIKAEEDKEKRKALDDASRIGGIMGFTGLEQQYNDELSGKLGVKTVSIDHRNNVTGTVSEVPSTPGNWLVTNIDAKVQAAAEKALEDRIEYVRTNPQISGEFRGQTAKGDAGAAVVLDIKTGGVVALASYPSYDPNVWMRPQSKEEVDALPQLHQATQGQYAPGSTFKVMTTAAAVKAGIANFHSSYNCVGSIQAGGRTFRNFDGSGYGWGTLHTALEKSCDTIYFQFGEQLWRADGGINPVAQPKDYVINEALDWGLGARTGVDLPGEAKGSVTTRAQVSETFKNNEDQCKAIPESERNPGLWEICDRAGKYRVGDALNTALGQGTTTATPLQMAVAYAALANGGTMCKPQIAKAIISPKGEVVKRFDPECDRHLNVSPDLLQQITSGLTDVPRTGTAANAFSGFPLDMIPVAGKTGTAQVGVNGSRFDTGWFASFAPADDPRYVVLMVISEGGGGGWASAPGVRTIYEAIYGVDGKEAILPPDGPPKDLPRIAADGTIEPPVVEVTTTHPDGVAGDGAASQGQTEPAALPSSAATLRGRSVRGRRR